ncbi:glycogen-binding domain-containing protein [Candidatus Omnitrophota bacterium]
MAKVRKKQSTRKAPRSKKMIQFTLEAPSAQRVNLVGSFNEWDAQSLSAKKDKKGMWKVRLSLPKGRHEYRFVVDDQWWNDPCCSDCAWNEFGSMNNVVEVK